MIPVDMLLDAVPNSVAFERFPELKRRIFDLFSLSVGEGTITDKMSALLCCLPDVPVPQGLDYSSIFRVAVINFMDRHDFSVGNVKRSCVHFVVPDGRIIPFETYNLFYRDGSVEAHRARIAGGR